jgi:hypothetical protein
MTTTGGIVLKKKWIDVLTLLGDIRESQSFVADHPQRKRYC